MTPILAEINMVPIGIAISVVAIIALVTVVAAAKRHDRQDAMGMLSQETIKRDKPAEFSPIGVQPTGREIEKIATLERKGVLVPTDKGEVSIAEFVPPDPESLGVARREFLNRGIVAFFGFGLSVFGIQIIAFLWPTPKGGFGSKIQVGKVDDIKAKIEAGSGYYYVPEGRMWITNYPVAALEKAKPVYPKAVLNAMEAGLSCLYQKCPHLGCRVPSCVSSQWFECPCHGSQYNLVGEKKGGPAPRGMDRFATEVSGGVLTVDTGTVFQGPPVGTNTTGQEAEGPHCVGGGGH